MGFGDKLNRILAKLSCKKSNAIDVRDTRSPQSTRQDQQSPDAGLDQLWASATDQFDGIFDPQAGEAVRREAGDLDMKGGDTDMKGKRKISAASTAE